MSAPDRKDRIEDVLKQMDGMPYYDAARAWLRLRGEMDNLTFPESKPPRFDTLLEAIRIAATNEKT